MVLRIKRYKADAMFSEYIRARDVVCQYCLQKAAAEVHHHFGRRFWSVRFDEQNCVGLCFTCHRLFHESPIVQVKWWEKRLGQDDYRNLMIRANNIEKKDWKMAELKVKAMMDLKSV